MPDTIYAVAIGPMGADSRNGCSTAVVTSSAAPAAVSSTPTTAASRMILIDSPCRYKGSRHSTDILIGPSLLAPVTRLKRALRRTK